MALLYPIHIFFSGKDEAGATLDLEKFIEYAYVAEPELLELDEEEELDHLPHRGYDEDFEDEWDEDYDYDEIVDYEEEY